MSDVFLQVFPIVIYFSAVINILYYWGLMQMVVSGIAWLMQFTMETTAIESLNAACNIFVGMVGLTESLSMIRSRLTSNELVGSINARQIATMAHSGELGFTNSIYLLDPMCHIFNDTIRYDTMQRV